VLQLLLCADALTLLWENKIKTPFLLFFRSLIRNFELTLEVTPAREKQNKNTFSFVFPLAYS